ncbi:MAG: hypothetical protein CMC70_09465 [Flavobacteriaceae bacterium]|nr:hypothetical protein [Flavobacteriaceae bacterium]
MIHRIVLFGLIFYSLNFFGQKNIQYEKGKLFSENQIGIDKFYFVHQTFADAFYMTNLYKQLTDEEMYSILYNAYYSVTKDQKVLVIIPQDNGPDARLAFQFIGDTEKLGDVLVLATNFNNKSRVFEEKVDSENSVYRWYKIEKGKLVYRQDIYSESAEKENIAKGTYHLIDLYLFDDNFENDNKVKPLIDNLLAADSEDLEKLYGYLYLGEYWLLHNDFKKAEESFLKLKNLVENSKTIPKGYFLIVNMAHTELEMMKRFKN